MRIVCKNLSQVKFRTADMKIRFTFSSVGFSGWIWLTLILALVAGAWLFLPQHFGPDHSRIGQDDKNSSARIASENTARVTSSSSVSSASPFGVTGGGGGESQRSPHHQTSQLLRMQDPLDPWLRHTLGSTDGDIRLAGQVTQGLCEALTTSDSYTMDAGKLEGAQWLYNNGKPFGEAWLLERQRVFDALRQACQKVTVTEKDFISAPKVNSEPLLLRYIRLRNGKQPQELAAAIINILQTASDEPAALDKYLEDIWRKPIAAKTRLSLMEQAYAHDAIYRAFFADPPDSLRTAWRCVIQGLCKPELVIDPARKPIADAFVRYVIDSIQQKQWHLFI
jgi:hypothetical protein